VEVIWCILSYTYRTKIIVLLFFINYYFSNFSHSTFPSFFFLQIAWGCGAFCGDKTAKFLQQIIACQLTNVHLFYSSFNDKKEKAGFEKLTTMLEREEITVFELYELLSTYLEKQIALIKDKTKKAQSFSNYVQLEIMKRSLKK